VFATVVIPIMLLSPAGIQGQEDQVLRQFALSTDSYARLHRSALESVPRALCGGPEEIESTRSLLDAEIRQLRPNAREGQIFTREVGVLIRRRLDAAIRDLQWLPRDLEMGPDGRAIRWIAEVNAGYPPSFGMQPWSAFNALPGLPGELEYRLVGYDLVLVDVLANLVVDVLRDAINGED
jgi:hypothetical protein